jgi:hypothetical protein
LSYFSLTSAFKNQAVCLRRQARFPCRARKLPVCRFKQFNQKKVPQEKPAAPEKKNILQHAP